MITILRHAFVFAVLSFSCTLAQDPLTEAGLKESQREMGRVYGQALSALNRDKVALWQRPRYADWHRATRTRRDAARKILDGLGDRLPESPAAAGELVSLMVYADRHEASPIHCLHFLSGLEGPLPPILPSKAPKPTKYDPKKHKEYMEEIQKEAARWKKQSEAFSAALSVLLAASWAPDAATLTRVFDRADELFPKGGALTNTAPVLARISLLAHRGLPAAEARRLRARVDRLVLKTAQAAHRRDARLIGRKSPPMKASRVIGDGPEKWKELAGKVVLVHLFEPGVFDTGIEGLIRRVAEVGSPDLAVIGVTHYTGAFMDPSRDLFEHARPAKALSRPAEEKHLAEWREAHGVPWPLWVHGNWKHASEKARDVKKLPANARSVGFARFLIIDREGVIRHFHTETSEPALDELFSVVRSVLGG